MNKFLLSILCATAAVAQPPASPATPGAKPAAPAGFRRPPDFPQRPPADPAVVESGKAIYGVHCTFCHGADARGGSGGPNLIRTSVVLNDQKGELIGPVLREGRQGMPKFDLPEAQVTAIAAFLHSFRVGGYDASRMTPPTIVTGDPKAGEAYFAKTCTGCHSLTNEAGKKSLAGIASRITDPKLLQQTWLMPGSGGGRGPGGGGAAVKLSPVMVTVTEAGKTHRGQLVRIDDFAVTLLDSEGAPRTFNRDGDTPKVELEDPLAGHRKLLPTYKDKDIHNLTAYLVTVK